MWKALTSAGWTMPETFWFVKVSQATWADSGVAEGSLAGGDGSASACPAPDRGPSLTKLCLSIIWANASRISMPHALKPC